MKKERYYFEIRFENGLKDKIGEICKNQFLSLSELVDRAFRFLAIHHNSGNIPFKSRSVFFSRLNKKDKFTSMIILKNDLHETVRNFAFAYRRSMAEVLRVSLEVYLEFLEKGESKIDKTIHYYKQPTSIIQYVIARLIPTFPPGIPPWKYNTIVFT